MAIDCQQKSVRPHCLRQTLVKINRLGWEVLPHPPYSHDIGPSDFHLFRSQHNFVSDKKFPNLVAEKNYIFGYFVLKDSILKICT